MILLFRILGIAAMSVCLYNICILMMFRREKYRSTTVATLIHVRSKKNVRVRKHGTSGLYVTVPHSSTGTYVYTVNGKEYRLKGWQHVAPGKLPKMPRVVYLIHNPRHAYLDCELMYLPEILRAFLSLMLGLTALGFGWVLGA